MGLFGGMKNFLTGGGAKVDLEIGSAVRGEPVSVKVTAEVGEKDIDVRKVYVRVRAQEVIDLPDVELAPPNPKAAPTRGLKRTTETFDQEFRIAGSQTLKAGETYEFDGEMTLPTQASPTFIGRYASHVWQVTAALDKSGNDPDSGWADIQVS
ncbi:MAG: sporulation protein [Rhodospirillaceae bacterium]|nr:sporulation protein [Rhodospirillaceae bacterium]